MQLSELQAVRCAGGKQLEGFGHNFSSQRAMISSCSQPSHLVLRFVADLVKQTCHVRFAIRVACGSVGVPAVEAAEAGGLYLQIDEAFPCERVQEFWCIVDFVQHMALLRANLPYQVRRMAGSQPGGIFLSSSLAA
eukprot:4042724-Amphidinium_carterae.1